MSNISMDENQTMLAESARKYVQRGYTSEARAISLASPHGCAPARWREFAELGWLALPLPEQDDGLGGSLPDICVLAEELGRALVTEPWIACGVLAASLLAATGNAAQRARWMPAIASGEKRIAFAAWEAGSRFDAQQIHLRAERNDGAYWLTGTKELVLGAPGADLLIVAALCDNGDGKPQPALFMVESGAAGLELKSYAMVDGRHAAHLRLHHVAVQAPARLDAATAVTQAIGQAIDRAVIAACAETTGVMAVALETTLDYLKTRKQFGRTLASNQALQHRLVDLHVAIEETRVLVRAAAAAFTGPELTRQAFVAAAKACTSQAARQVWEETVQMHGAIGMTNDYMLGAYTRHLAASHALFGDADHHLERLAAVEDQLHAAAGANALRI